MQAETAFGRIFDNGLELSPVLREVLRMTADERSVVTEPDMYLPR